MPQSEVPKTIETHDNHDQHHLAVLYYHMQIVKARNGINVELQLFSDGSGTIKYDGAERMFGSIEVASYLVREIDEKGYMA